MHPRLPIAVALAATAFDAAAANRGFILAASPPTNNSEASAAAIDLDGDGGAENNFGQFFSAMTQNAGFDFTAAVSAGEVVYLLRLASADPTFANDPAAVAEWVVGRPTAPALPDFSGAGSFGIDTNFEPARFVAPLASSTFVSANPVTTTAPVTATIQFDLAGRVVLPLNGARLAFTVTPGGLVSGQINGSVTDEDIQAIFIPSLANEFNERIAANDPSKPTLLGIFDDGCNGVGANDGFIAVCEVVDSVVGSILQPDVSIFSTGGYAPNPNGVPDSISFGMRFTASNAAVPLEVVFADSFE